MREITTIYFFRRANTNFPLQSGAFSGFAVLNSTQSRLSNSMVRNKTETNFNIIKNQDFILPVQASNEIGLGASENNV